jgi:hypothetical protein
MASHITATCAVDNIFENACADTVESMSVIIPYETFVYP